PNASEKILFEEGAQGPKRLTAVAHVALSDAHFGERPAERRIEKDRVVAESVGASRRCRDAAFHGSARLEQRRARPCERQGADESRRAGRRAGRAQRVVDQRELFRIGRVGAAKARRLDAWSAA